MWVIGYIYNFYAPANTWNNESLWITYPELPIKNYTRRSNFLCSDSWTLHNNCTGTEYPIINQWSFHIGRESCSLLNVKSKIFTKMTLSFINNSRQSITMEKQLLLSKRKRNILWNQIISCKIYNQASVLRLLEKTGVQEIVSYKNKFIMEIEKM